MSLLDSLERRLSRLAIPHVTLYLVIAQSVVWVFLKGHPELANQILFVPERVARGEVWRIFTFVTIPPSPNPLWAFFGLYFFYIMGTALEAYWGEFRYNLYLLIGVAATMVAACLTPSQPATNAFIGGSVFLAFAWLYPDFQILLFFILPIRIKWLALLTWIGYGAALIFSGGWSTRALILAAVANFLLFFGRAIWMRMRSGNRRMLAQARDLAERGQAFHTCAACGITDKTHPQMEFRYCPECAGSPGYCMEHIFNHHHRVAEKQQGRGVVKSEGRG